MIKPAKYPCNGGEYTVAEAARQLGMSPETIRIRLNKYGGNMQRVWDHYAGVPADETETAVNEIMSALGMSAAEPAEETPEAGEPDAPAADEPETPAADEPETPAADEPETPAEPEAAWEPEDAPLTALRRLNRAIEALSGLHEGDVGGLSKDVARILNALRAIRATRYEKYVDWNAVAFGGVKKYENG